MQDMARWEPVPGHDWQTFGPEHCIAGGAAVLLKFHLPWLKKNREREQRCIKILRDLVLNLREPGPLQLFETSMEARWQGFCADILPILWADDPGNKDLRLCVAILAIDSHYDTAEILMDSAAQCRQRLGNDFSRLRHLAMRWAVARRLDWLGTGQQTQDSGIREWLCKESELR